MSGERDDLAMAVDVLRIMREALGPDRFRRAVEEAESPAPERRGPRARVSAVEAARRATAVAPPDELARARARRGR